MQQQRNIQVNLEAERKKNLSKGRGNHKTVAECLMNDPLNRGRFELLLNNMRTLFEEMFATQIGKNPLSEEYSKLEEFYNRWIIQIDGIVGMIDWREWK